MHRPKVNATNVALYNGLPVQDTGDSVSTVLYGSTLDLQDYTGIASFVLGVPAISSTDTSESPEVVVSIQTATDTAFTTPTAEYVFDTIDTADTAGTFAGAEIDLQSCSRYMRAAVTVTSGTAATAPVVLAGLFVNKNW